MTVSGCSSSPTKSASGEKSCGSSGADSFSASDDFLRAILSSNGARSRKRGDVTTTRVNSSCSSVSTASHGAPSVKTAESARRWAAVSKASQSAKYLWGRSASKASSADQTTSLILTRPASKASCGSIPRPTRRHANVGSDRSLPWKMRGQRPPGSRRRRVSTRTAVAGSSPARHWRCNSSSTSKTASPPGAKATERRRLTSNKWSDVATSTGPLPAWRRQASRDWRMDCACVPCQSSPTSTNSMARARAPPNFSRTWATISAPR
mmetsp:Transcript_291/g.1077  ORF Transcript_291/g.1077 Transcript_291/m.1077 type:complete len:265 (-) Transcript_291:172-966(-)